MPWRFGLGRVDREQALDATSPAGDQTRAGQIEIEILTEESGCTVLVEVGPDRLTDVLNRAEPGARWTSDPTAPDLDEILVAFPPPQETDAQRRLHRPRQPLKLCVGSYEVSGQVHVPPGTQASGYLNRVNPHFLPLTDVVVRRPDTERLERRARVAIVNFRAASIVRDISEADEERPMVPDAGVAEPLPDDQPPPSLL
ncbi:MAG: hypothetical protein WED86_07115 [Chloroflexota bacterium]